MRILHVIPSVSPLRGGPSVMIRVLTRELAKAGLMVDVATTDDNGRGRLSVMLGQSIVEDGVSYRYFRRQTFFYTFSWPLTRWLALHVADYDLVHIHALFSYPSISAAFWAWRRRVPYIVRPLGVLTHWSMRHRRPWLKRGSFSLIERRILSGAAAVHYTSEQEIREAADLGVRHRAELIPNAVGVPPHTSRKVQGQFREGHPELANRPLVLFLSRLDQKKGLDLLLHAFADVIQEHPRAILAIAGNGEAAFVETLKQTAARIGLSRHLIWTGFLAGDDKWAALADADLFVLPSYSENFGIAVAESLACGVPVVISDQVGIHHEISGSGAGVVVPCDPKPLAKAITRVLADATLRARMAVAARQCAREQFSLTVMTQKILRLYQEIVAPALKSFPSQTLVIDASANETSD